MVLVYDELKVHGIDGLRVIDASAIPAVTSANTNAPTIMIATLAVLFFMIFPRQRVLNILSSSIGEPRR